MKTSTAEVLREYGPFPDTDGVNGVTYDGKNVWFASGNKLQAFDPKSFLTGLERFDLRWQIFETHVPTAVEV